MQTVCKLLYLPFKKYKICLQVTCTCDMANRITVKCDGVEEEKSLSTNVDTIFKLRQLLQKEHFKKYPVVLYKEKKVPKLSDPIPMDGNNELLHFISKIGKI